MQKKEFTKNRYIMFLLVALFFLLTSCTTSPPQSNQQQVVLPSRITPECAGTMLSDGQSAGDTIPSNITNVLGFQIMLPRSLPHGVFGILPMKKVQLGANIIQE